MDTLFKLLLQKIKEYNPGFDSERVTKAYNLAAEAHKGQKRVSGEPYIIHPLAVAHIIADMQLDSPLNKPSRLVHTK